MYPHETEVRRRVLWHRNDFGFYVSENGVCVRRLYRVAFTAYITVGERVLWRRWRWVKVSDNKSAVINITS